MELHLDWRRHRWERRLPDLKAAAAAGLVAGAVAMVLELLWATFIEGSPWRTSHAIAALLLGPGALQDAEFSAPVVSAALAVHYLLGVIFAFVLALLIAPLHLDSSAPMVAAGGALFGVALYVVNFYLMVEIFPWFAQGRGIETLVLHLAFGISAALAYWMLERTPPST